MAHHYRDQLTVRRSGGVSALLRDSFDDCRARSSWANCRTGSAHPTGTSTATWHNRVCGRETADCALSRFRMFFDLNNPLACLLNIIPQWLVILGTVDRFRRLDRVAVWWLVPLVAWVAFEACSTERLRHAGHRERPHYPSKRTGWPVASAAGLCQKRTFQAVPGPGFFRPLLAAAWWSDLPEHRPLAATHR